MKILRNSNSNHQNVIWLGFCVPEEIAQHIFSLDPLPAVQTYKFGWSFARSLKFAFKDVTLASSVPVQNFPLVRRLVFRGSQFTSGELKGILLGFINVILLKHATRLISCFFKILPMLGSKNIEWIFIHGLHSPYLFFGLLSRLRGCRVVVVLTDPSGMVLATDGYFARLLKRIDAWFIKKMLENVDGVIALAPELVRTFSPFLPAISFPGILEGSLNNYNEVLREGADENLNLTPFTIVYAGGLNKAYGIDRLIDAVFGMDLKLPIRLKLFGRGDEEDRISSLAKSDHRFFYGGFVNSENLLPHLSNADLLINPRPTTESFAALSFPSKLIEYLAIGRPVLTTRLESIPFSLRDHYYYIYDESVEGIRSAIQSMMKLSPQERNVKATYAREFVRSEFSEEATGRKISSFINSLNHIN